MLHDTELIEDIKYAESCQLIKLENSHDCNIKMLNLLNPLSGQRVCYSLLTIKSGKPLTTSSKMHEISLVKGCSQH